MRTIQIKKQSKAVLKEYGNGSFDDIVNQLIDDVKEDIPSMEIEHSVKSTMRLHDDTVELLDSYKLNPSESYENVILRLLSLAKDLNRNTD